MGRAKLEEGADVPQPSLANSGTPSKSQLPIGEAHPGTGACVPQTSIRTCLGENGMRQGHSFRRSPRVCPERRIGLRRSTMQFASITIDSKRWQTVWGCTSRQSA